MLTRNERIIVEAIRKSKAVEIHLLDIDRGGSHNIRVSRDTTFCHDVAIAMQGFFNRNK